MRVLHWAALFLFSANVDAQVERDAAVEGTAQCPSAEEVRQSLALQDLAKSRLIWLLAMRCLPDDEFVAALTASAVPAGGIVRPRGN